MPRMARIVIPGQPHDIVRRANNRQDDFFVDDDRRAYLEFFREHFGYKVHGYCLMTHPIHLVGTPALDDSQAKAVDAAHFRSSQ